MERAPELVPDLSKASIRDRSKADGMAKALLVWQVLYFCFSAVARVAQSLPLSLLEVSTLAHSFCTVLTYIVWWKKPVNIQEPTPIAGDRATELAALLLMMSDARRFWMAGIFCMWCERELSYVDVPADHAENTSRRIIDNPAADTITLRPQQVLAGTTFSPRDVNPGPFSQFAFKGRPLPWFCQPRLAERAVQLAVADRNRWRLATRAISRLQLDASAVKNMSKGHQYAAPYTGLQAMAFIYYPGFEGGSVWQVLAMVIAMTIYGLPHCVFGWNVQFPTTFERDLWRVATLILSTLGLLPFGMYLVVHYTSANRFGFVRALAVIAYTAWPILYVFSSGYLVVECLRQMFYLPEAAFSLPHFTSYWPHFA